MRSLLKGFMNHRGHTFTLPDWRGFLHKTITDGGLLAYANDMRES